MKTVNIHLDKLVDKIEVKCSGDAEKASKEVMQRLLRALSCGGAVAGDFKEEVHETRIEIIERVHSEKKNGENIGRALKKEIIIMADGKEIFHQHFNPNIKMPPTPLDDFLKWILKATY